MSLETLMALPEMQPTILSTSDEIRLLKALMAEFSTTERGEDAWVVLATEKVTMARMDNHWEQQPDYLQVCEELRAWVKANRTQLMARWPKFFRDVRSTYDGIA